MPQHPPHHRRWLQQWCCLERSPARRSSGRSATRAARLAARGASSPPNAAWVYGGVGEAAGAAGGNAGGVEAPAVGGGPPQTTNDGLRGPSRGGVAVSSSWAGWSQAGSRERSCAHNSGELLRRPGGVQQQPGGVDQPASMDGGGNDDSGERGVLLRGLLPRDQGGSGLVVCRERGEVAAGAKPSSPFVGRSRMSPSWTCPP